MITSLPQWRDRFALIWDEELRASLAQLYIPNEFQTRGYQMKPILNKIAQVLRKPPKVILAKVIQELRGEIERYTAPSRTQRFKAQALLHAVGQPDMQTLWNALANTPHLGISCPEEVADYERLFPGDKARILEAAQEALEHRIDLLGSGRIGLGKKIDWHKDYKTNLSWQPAYMKRIEYNNPDKPSDVKMPWEVSRLQWLIPAGQAYLLTKEERYAELVRDVLADWIDNNPYAFSINWSCTMEVALRVFGWTWFFHVFHTAPSWQDPAFREKFLCALYLHGEFTLRYIERSDVNGNHFTADAAALVVAGLFWGKAKEPQRWLEEGWNALCDELPKQVCSDGVDFEASVPYHRLVTELFLYPALLREKLGHDVPTTYRERVTKMAVFSEAYSRANGTVPLFGDADDARALPFGAQNLNDHRYLSGIVGILWKTPTMVSRFSGSRTEPFWLLGREVACALPDTLLPTLPIPSQAFEAGGFYVLRSEQDHVFIDCGPVGFGNRGGHGHNDILSFEASLCGINLVSDCGAYLYTASYAERNNFRSTAYHNTPQIDSEEANRFISPDLLWYLHYDAIPQKRLWEETPEVCQFVGSHSGYTRLAKPVTPVRKIALDKRRHALAIQDTFEGVGSHQIEIPLHLAPHVTAVRNPGDVLVLLAEGRRFHIFVESTGNWNFEQTAGRVSESYGTTVPVQRLAWSHTGEMPCTFTLCLIPEESVPENITRWLREVLPA